MKLAELTWPDVAALGKDTAAKTCRVNRRPSRYASATTRGWATHDRSAHGHIGDPREASAEKGEALFHAFTRGAMSLVERMIAWDGTSWDG